MPQYRKLHYTFIIRNLSSCWGHIWKIHAENAFAYEYINSCALSHSYPRARVCNIITYN